MKTTNIKKHYFSRFGHWYYFIGTDEQGTKYYLEQAHFDCGWYWGIGYIETFTNNTHPELSKDITSHQHFDSMMKDIGYEKRLYHIDAFKALFPHNPFTDKEIWTIIELLNSAYTVREYSDMLHIGGSHVTSNPAKELIQNEEEYKRINEIVIPGIMKELYKIMTESEEEKNENV